MKGIFVGSNVTDLKNRFLAVTDYFKTKDSSFEAFFISAEASPVVREINEAAFEAIVSKGIKIERFKSFNHQRVRNKLLSIRPDFMFTASLNVYNQIWDSICKEYHIPIYYYPHGFQIDNLYYNSSGLWHKLIKVTRYTYGLYNISKIIHKPFMKLFKSYVGYISNGADMNGSELDDSRLYPDVAFVTSDYYKKFYERKYGIKNIRYEFIMPCDFTQIEQILEKPKEEDAACYITQTLHEDGRLTKEAYDSLLESLKPVASAVGKLYIKLHPRVDSAMYDKAFAGISNVEIIRDFPHCKCYFTHYSSMAYTSALVSGKTIIYELPGQPTHEVFKEVATEIVYNVPELISALERQMATPEIPFDERKKIISKYATYTGISPYEVLYKTIYDKK